MDVLSHIESDPFGSNNSNGYGNLPRNFIGNSDEWMNLSGQLLLDWQTCRDAEAIYNAALAAWTKYNADLNAYNASRQTMGCDTLVAPPTPTYQEAILNPVGACDAKANQAVITTNAAMQSAYNTAYSVYQTKLNACNALTRPLAVINPGTFTPPSIGSTPYIGADGMPYFGATGIFDRLSPVRVRKNPYHNAVVKMKGGYLNAAGEYLNCAPCAALLAATGDPDPTTVGAKPNFITVLVLIGASLLMYKLFVKDQK